MTYFCTLCEWNSIQYVLLSGFIWSVLCAAAVHSFYFLCSIPLWNPTQPIHPFIHFPIYKQLCYMRTAKHWDCYKYYEHSDTHIFILCTHIFGTYLRVTLLVTDVSTFRFVNVKQFFKMVLPIYMMLLHLSLILQLAVFHHG